MSQTVGCDSLSLWCMLKARVRAQVLIGQAGSESHLAVSLLVSPAGMVQQFCASVSHLKNCLKYQLPPRAVGAWREDASEEMATGPSEEQARTRLGQSGTCLLMDENISVRMASAAQVRKWITNRTRAESPSPPALPGHVLCAWPR